MAKTFQVFIVTPENIAYEERAVSIILPGIEGYLGAWANHAPLVTGVRPGVVWMKINDAGDERYFAVGKGFCEISDNSVNLMVDHATAATDIDLTAARSELNAARTALRNLGPDGDPDAARLAIERAESRVSAAERQQPQRR
ncbi:MAG: ATP synthase F1 subunit epsilon [Candidatus Krumholzibacteriia bacterium]